MRICADAVPTVEDSGMFFGIPTLKIPAYVTDSSSDAPLYVKATQEKLKEVELRLIPYFGFANRGESNMRVWFLLR